MFTHEKRKDAREEIGRTRREKMHEKRKE